MNMLSNFKWSYYNFNKYHYRDIILINRLSIHLLIDKKYNFFDNFDKNQNLNNNQGHTIYNLLNYINDNQEDILNKYQLMLDKIHLRKLYMLLNFHMKCILILKNMKHMKIHLNNIHQYNLGKQMENIQNKKVKYQYNDNKNQNSNNNLTDIENSQQLNYMIHIVDNNANIYYYYYRIQMDKSNNVYYYINHKEIDNQNIVLNLNIIQFSNLSRKMFNYNLNNHIHIINKFHLRDNSLVYNQSIRLQNHK